MLDLERAGLALDTASARTWRPTGFGWAMGGRQETELAGHRWIYDAAVASNRLVPEQKLLTLKSERIESDGQVPKLQVRVSVAEKRWRLRPVTGRLFLVQSSSTPAIDAS